MKELLLYFRARKNWFFFPLLGVLLGLVLLLILMEVAPAVSPFIYTLF